MLPRAHRTRVTTRAKLGDWKVQKCQDALTAAGEALIAA